MSTHDWMRSEYPARAAAATTERADDQRRQRTVVEVALAISGFAAWIWCAWEVGKALLH